MPQHLLAIDQGTTNSRAIIFTTQGQPISQQQLELKQFYPNLGWVEHDPEEIWQATLTTCRNALAEKSLSAKDILAIGISNQRETTIIWDRKTGAPIYNAIVWQDRRTVEYCQRYAKHPIATQIQDKTGLLLDPYFSATKILWLLDSIPNARARAENGELAFGTVDSFLLWRLTQGKRHATDATNAARTLLFNIHTQKWDADILQAFNIPLALLPEVLDNSADFGVTDASYFGAEIPITGMAGDQQAATFGQACFSPGMVKSTYGTGCFVLLNTGDHVIKSQNKLLSTIAYRLHGKVTYGLEGSIFVAGAAIKWLRDELKLITKASDSEALAASVPDNGGVYFVPAFTGLGAPYWDPLARGALLGLTRNSSIAHIVRAALEAVCYQTGDLLRAMHQDGATIKSLRVDGGMAANNWLLQFLADILHVNIERPVCTETSALGVVFLAGLQMGVYKSLADITNLCGNSASFTPKMPMSDRQQLCDSWNRAVARITEHKR